MSARLLSAGAALLKVLSKVLSKELKRRVGFSLSQIGRVKTFDYASEEVINSLEAKNKEQFKSWLSTKLQEIVISKHQYSLLGDRDMLEINEAYYEYYSSFWDWTSKYCLMEEESEQLAPEPKPLALAA